MNHSDDRKVWREREREGERESERNELTKPNGDTDLVSGGVMNKRWAAFGNCSDVGDCANMQGMRSVTSYHHPLQFDDVCEHIIPFQFEMLEISWCFYL